jgi:DNA polymerase-1
MIYTNTKRNIQTDISDPVPLSAVRKFIESCSEVGLDIETTGLNPIEDKILTIQFGNFDNQYIVDYDDSLIPFLQEVLSLDIIYVLQNAKFDLSFLLWKTKIIPYKIFDTFLAEKVLNQGISSTRYSLEVLSQKYLGIQLDKDTRKILSRGLSDERVIQYSAEDVKVLLPIKHIQEDLIRRADMKRALDIENHFVKALAYMELSGMYLNREKWEEKCIKDDILLVEQEAKLNEWVLSNAKKYKFGDIAIAQPDLFNTSPRCSILWSSPKQVIKLFGIIGIDTKTVDEETGELKDSVEAGVLLHQSERFPIIPIYLRYKELAKVCSTYGRNFYKHISPTTGRLHTKFNQLVDTGRLSSGGKDRKTKEEYVNFQNIPADHTRECFTAQPGNKLINADFNGQEQVIFANKCLDPKLLQFYDDKMGDMHAFMASKIFKYIGDTPLSEIPTKFKKERQKAKAAGFSINYGGDGRTIAENLNISMEEGNEVYKAYFEAFPDIDKYFKRVQKDAFKNGYILINEVTGRKFYIEYFKDFLALKQKVSKDNFWENRVVEKEKDSVVYYQYYKPLTSKYSKLKKTIEKMALNYSIQGTAAEVSKLATYYIFRHIYENNLLFKVLLSNMIHDEILLEAPEAIAASIAEETTKSMIRAGVILELTRVPLTADAKVVDWWNH